MSENHWCFWDETHADLREFKARTTIGTMLDSPHHQQRYQDLLEELELFEAYARNKAEEDRENGLSSQTPYL